MAFAEAAISFMSCWRSLTVSSTAVAETVMHIDSTRIAKLRTMLRRAPVRNADCVFVLINFPGHAKFARAAQKSRLRCLYLILEYGSFTKMTSTIRVQWGSWS
jgi:hypothetical protein